VRTSSNPVFRNLPAQGGYASFGPGQTGQQSAPQGYGQQGYGQQPYGQPQPYTTGRTMTVDDVVTKTASTLGALVVTAGISAFLISQNNSLALPFLLVGGIVGFVLVLVATLGRKMNPAIVLSYAVAEGLFVGAISYVLEATTVGTIVPQAIIGTVGVFVGMLVVYKTGAVRVTPRLTKMVLAGLIGVVVLMVANIVAGFFVDGGLGLRDGGPLAIVFSLVCIALAAFNFLLDFDQADKLIRAGAPEKAAWGVALGLTVTLVWLYVEILRLLSYFNRG
jgi:uncharacterized YccA/Bax inhibitor family protein